MFIFYEVLEFLVFILYISLIKYDLWDFLKSKYSCSLYKNTHKGLFTKSYEQIANYYRALNIYYKLTLSYWLYFYDSYSMYIKCEHVL